MSSTLGVLGAVVVLVILVLFLVHRSQTPATTQPAVPKPPPHVAHATIPSRRTPPAPDMTTKESDLISVRFDFVLSSFTGATSAHVKDALRGMTVPVQITTLALAAQDSSEKPSLMMCRVSRSHKDAVRLAVESALSTVGGTVKKVTFFI